MRPLLILVCASLAAAALSTALAQPNRSASPDERASPCGARPAAGNVTPALREWAKACRANMTDLRQDALRSFADQRLVLEAKFDAKMAHVRVDFLDGKVASIQKCLAQASSFDRNASGPRSGVYGECMKGELKTLRDAAGASRNSTQADFRASATKDRDDAKARFQQDADAWLAANPRPS